MPSTTKKWHIGIDLGTTNSCICYTSFNPGKQQFEDPVPIKFDGDQTLLSALLFDQTGASLVQLGKSVYDHPDAINYPDRVHTEFKLEFGHKPSAENCMKILVSGLKEGLERKLPDSLTTENTLTNVGVPAEWLNKRPEEVYLLKQIVSDIGFPNVEIFSEPVAAMLYHSFLGQLPFEHQPQNWLVVDIGGGTTDLAFIRTQPDNNQPHVINTYGFDLGGKNFDQMIYEKVFIKKHWVGNPPTASQNLELLKASQKFKEGFSSAIVTGKTKYSESFRSIRNLKNPVELSWEDFSSAIFAGPLIEKFGHIVGTGVENFAYGAGSIEKIILTGGSSRWSFVRYQLEFLRSEENILRSIDPDLTVSKGLSLARTDFIPPKPVKIEKVASWADESSIATSEVVANAKKTNSIKKAREILENINLEELSPDFNLSKETCRQKAKEKIAWFAGGGALGTAAVAQIPGVASAGLPLVETKLIVDVARVYGYSLDTQQAVAIGGSMILSGMVVKMGVLELVGLLPVLGNVIKGGATAAFIVALGKATINFLEKRRFGQNGNIE